MPSSPADLLDGWLTARLDESSAAWLHEKVGDALRGGADAAFFLAFGMVPRRTGREPLGLSPDELARAAAARPGWDPSRWTRDQAARTLLLLALPSADQAAHGALLDRLQHDADLGELVALFQALPLLPHPAAHRERAAEGIRSNMLPVFEAIALHNPYPAEELDDGAWAQVVLKCLFVEAPLHRVHGLDARATPELGRMLSAYAHERWAAGRPVSPELWRSVGPVADGALLADLERVLATGSPRERAAVALSARSNAEVRPLLDAHARAIESALQEFPSWEAISTP